MKLLLLVEVLALFTWGNAQSDACASADFAPCRSQCNVCSGSATCRDQFQSTLVGYIDDCAAAEDCFNLVCCRRLVEDPVDSYCADVPGALPSTSSVGAETDESLEVSTSVGRKFFGSTYVLNAVKGITVDSVRSHIEEMLAADCDDAFCMQELWDALHDLECSWSNPLAAVEYSDPFTASVSFADYSSRGELICQAPPSELAWLINCLAIGAIVMGCWCIGACSFGKRSPRDVAAGVAKVPTNIARAICTKMVRYTVGQDDEDFFNEWIPNLPGPADAATNIFQYMAWRRRALYALLPLIFILWLNTIFVALPTIKKLADLFECHPGDSLLACGGTGSLYQFLMAGDAARGLYRYQIFMVSSTIAMLGFQFVAIRVAASRAGNWQRSRYWVFLGWFLPFGFLYFQFFFPNEQLFMVDYEARSNQAVMMPYFSNDPTRSTFNFCTATHTCAAKVDMRQAVLAQVCHMFVEDPSCDGKTVQDISAFMRGHQYDSQAGPGAMTIKLGDTGEFYVKEMTDLTDFFVSLFGGGDFGEISSSARNLLDAFGIFLRGLVRTKTSFACLSALAPLALSLLPALQRAALAAKLVFPQDPFVGWIVRAVPLLAVPLHTVFILLVGQMFSDWWVCLACVCLMIAMSAITLFGAGVIPPTADAGEINRAFTKAKRKGVAFNLFAVLFFVAAVATNESLSEIMPGLSVSSDQEEQINVGNTARLVHWVCIFFCNFFVTRIQVTIMGADMILSMMFEMNQHLENQELQAPYRDEAKQACEGMIRVSQEGDLPPLGFLSDLFGGDQAQKATSSDGGDVANCKIENPIDAMAVE